tara:strand:- start:3369 stop:4631 length:1263 start_codon:yes stop_codon:yes gene_type:complete
MVDSKKSELQGLDASAVKSDFPLLKREVNGNQIVYLDSAATSQKPQVVLDVLNSYYEDINANVHRGAYKIAEQATIAMEDARASVRQFIGAKSDQEIIFTKNATEAINLVAYSWGRKNLNEGDAVLITALEHHANIVPWHQLVAEKGIELRWIPLTEDGQLDLDNLDVLMDGVKLVSVAAVSNVLGTVNPIKEIADAAHQAGALCLIDACQSVPHMPTDVIDIGCDFLAFSGHKMCGPTGIGVLWGRREILEEMPPFLGGGEMILNVTQEGFTTNDLPWKFEAGTPPIAEIIGLGAAVKYLTSIGMQNVQAHGNELTQYMIETLSERFGSDLSCYGPQDANLKTGVFSMSYRDIHPHDLSQVLDQQGICVRAGHHCAKPLMKLLNVNATIRASLYLYNEKEDIDALVTGIESAGKFFEAR